MLGRTHCGRRNCDLALEKERLRIIDWEDLDVSDREHRKCSSGQRVFPVLTPPSVDLAHLFPYVSSLSLNLAAFVRDPLERGTPSSPG